MPHFSRNDRILSDRRLENDPDIAGQVHWERDFAIGSVVDASVHELKDYGVVLDFAAHADVLGLAATHQVGFFLRLIDL